MYIIYSLQICYRCTRGIVLLKAIVKFFPDIWLVFAYTVTYSCMNMKVCHTLHCINRYVNKQSVFLIP